MRSWPGLYSNLHTITDTVCVSVCVRACMLLTYICMYLLTQDCFSCTSPLENPVQWCVLRLTDIAGESVRATWALHGMLKGHTLQQETC